MPQRGFVVACKCDVMILNVTSPRAMTSSSTLGKIKLEWTFGTLQFPLRSQAKCNVAILQCVVL